MVFPGRDAVVAAMKKSNPTVDPYSITVENGTNQNTGGGLTNEIGVDWFALDGAASFQKSMEDAGYVSVMDLEGPAATTKASERIGQSTLRTTATYAVPIAILGIIVALANKSRQSDADDS